MAVATVGPAWTPERCAGKEAGTDNCDNTDSSGFTFTGLGVEFAVAREATSKEAQLSALDFSGCTTD